MFVVNEDNSIYATRGDIVFFRVSADDNGSRYKFQPGEIVRISVYGKKDAGGVVLQKDFPVTTITEYVDVVLDEADTKFGDIISKHKDYWYEVVLNPDTDPQTIVGYDEDGAKIFRLFPEAAELDETPTKPEDIPVVDGKLDMTSPRPVANSAVAAAIANMMDVCEKTNAAVAELYVTPEMFGAIGDGKADDTEALEAAAAYCREKNGVLTIPSGSYRISRTLDLRYIDLDIRGTIIVTHSGVGVLVGDRSSSAERRIIKINRVYHTNYAEGDISVRIVGVMNAEVNIANAHFVQLYADGDSEYSSIAYSDFHIGKCAYLQITDKADTANIGWINENTFYNCRVMVRFSIEGHTYTHNNNVFYKPCFENADCVLSKCTRNKFYDIRTEGEFTITMAEDTSLNLVEYNFYYTFPFVADQYVGVTDNGVNNIVTNTTMRDLDSVVVYSMNAKTVAKNLYEIGTAKANTSVTDDSVTIASAWARIIEDAVIPVKDIRYLRAVSDAGAFRFSFTPLNANKEVMKNNPLTQDGNGAGADSNGTYSIATDTWGALIAINDPDVAYIKLSITTGSSASSFSFTNMSLLAYYHPRDARRAVMLADHFKTAIPS